MTICESQQLWSLSLYVLQLHDEPAKLGCNGPASLELLRRMRDAEAAKLPRPCRYHRRYGAVAASQHDWTALEAQQHHESLSTPSRQSVLGILFWA